MIHGAILDDAVKPKTFVFIRPIHRKKGLLLKKNAKFHFRVVPKKRDAPKEPNREGSQGNPNWTPRPPGKNPIDP